jgi:hypothetical protein
MRKYMSTIFYQKGRLSSPPQRRGFPGGTDVKVAGLSWLFQKAKYQAQAEKDYGKSNNVKAEIHALKAPAA